MKKRTAEQQRQYDENCFRLAKVFRDLAILAGTYDYDPMIEKAFQKGEREYKKHFRSKKKAV